MMTRRSTSSCRLRMNEKKEELLHCEVLAMNKEQSCHVFHE